jgi:glycosyltransferase involved in cell wall biosynthesis
VKIVLITSVASPYIVTFCNEVNKNVGDSFTVIYCSRSQHMPWENKNISHNHLFLDSKQFTFLKNTYLYNSSIWGNLGLIKPDFIVSCGFQVPMLMGILYSFIKNKGLYIMSDSWALKEKKLTYFHRLIRKVVYKKANGFFPVSIKGKTNFQSYGISPTKIFIVSYVINTELYSKFSQAAFIERPYDIMFSGQFIERKMPFFFVEVAVKVKLKFDALKVLIIGSGPLENSFISKLKEEEIEFDYFGFIQPDDIPSYYAKAKILLFTTNEDSWGVVANEAVATSTPVITSQYAGAADEIVINERNGYVLPLNSDVWAEKTLGLLNSPELYRKFQEECIEVNVSFKPSVAVKNFLRPFYETKIGD